MLLFSDIYCLGLRAEVYVLFVEGCLLCMGLPERWFDFETWIYCRFMSFLWVMVCLSLCLGFSSSFLGVLLF